jgi:hypothetical protein
MALHGFYLPSGTLPPGTDSTCAYGWANNPPVTASISPSAAVTIDPIVTGKAWVFAFNGLSSGTTYTITITDSTGAHLPTSSFAVAPGPTTLLTVDQPIVPGPVRRRNVVAWGKSTSPLVQFTMQLVNPAQVVGGNQLRDFTKPRWVVQFVNLPGMGSGNTNGLFVVTNAALEIQSLNNLLVTD